MAPSCADGYAIFTCSVVSAISIEGATGVGDGFMHTRGDGSCMRFEEGMWLPAAFSVGIEPRLPWPYP